MTQHFDRLWLSIAAAVLLCMACGSFALYMYMNPIKAPEKPPETAVAEPLRDAQLLAVAGVLGQFQECRDRFPAIAYAVTNAARAAALRPQLLASVVAVESRCDNLSVSGKGAIGIAQVMPRVWRSEFDFSGRYNLFNAEDNLYVGSTILAREIKNHGLRQGLERYQGTGAGRDGTYVERILKLAGEK